MQEQLKPSSATPLQETVISHPHDVSSVLGQMPE
jgi:hypothetical protein